MEKGVGDVKLSHGPSATDNRASTVRIVVGLTTGVKVSPKLMPKHWVKLHTTHHALYRSRLPLGWSLCLNTHFVGDDVGAGRWKD